ncbi:MAG: GDSL-type esterase/lipase family protein [Acidobacteria bacterium]|nr:GDSL-type esterase/lipase family protein [Acidobacteriota bacterium]
MRSLLLFALLALPLAAQPPAAPADTNWIPARDARFEVNGLPWFQENNGEWIRLPLRLKGQVRDAVWNLSQDPSGGRIRFRTDSNLIALRLEFPSPPEMGNMHAYGQSGVDLYLDGFYRGSAVANKDSKPGKIVDHVYIDLKDQPRKEREVVLYLSLYKPVKVVAIGLDKDAQVRKARPFAVAGPVVYYGTSITQGGCASRSGMSYQAILGRMLNTDFVNLGYSGNGLGEPEMARAVAEIDASMFVFDFAQNNRTVASLRQNYEPFLNTVREKHPKTPILVITPIANSRETLSATHTELEGMRELIRLIASKHIAAGDEHLQVVEGTDLLGFDKMDGVVDGVHPNDLGFQWMAEGLAPRLKKVFELDRPIR